VRTDQLQSEFPPAGFETLQERKPLGNHQSQVAWDAYLKIYPSQAERKGVTQKQQLARVNDALKREGKNEISHTTFKRLLSAKL
jgi:hypothetical protein